MYKIEVKITKLLGDKKTKDPERKKMITSVVIEDNLLKDITENKNYTDLIASMLTEVIGKEWKKRYPKDFEQ